jgi:predicted PolB exonuclease-like 3'-5' exonuclease
MKRLRSNIKHTLTNEQQTFLQKIINENFDLSKREHYVVKYVLNWGTYHDNYQYHLNNVGERYKKTKSEL